MTTETVFEEPGVESVEEYHPPQEEAYEESSKTEILAAVTVPISIELSRIQLSLREVGELESGQIVETNKSPGDLVNLVVSGKIIGKGELVDIDGELGVRIASLVK